MLAVPAFLVIQLFPVCIRNGKTAQKALQDFGSPEKERKEEREQGEETLWESFFPFHFYGPPRASAPTEQTAVSHVIASPVRLASPSGGGVSGV